MSVRVQLTAFLVLTLLAAPSWAQGNGNGNSGGNGNGSESQGSDNGNGGNGGGNDNSGNSGKAGGGNSGGAGSSGNTGNNGASGNGNSGNANNSGSNGAPGQSGSQAEPVPGSPERAALEAVQSGRAVPLETVLPDVRATSGGEVIDAELVTVNGFLLYAIKVLTPAGRVSVQYYYANSGRRVEVR